MSDILIRRAEPSDAEQLYEVFSCPRVVRGTLQLPFPSIAAWRKWLAEPPEGLYAFVACVDGKVVGDLGLHTYPSRPRRSHAGEIGMAVHDDWQGKGIGTALMGTAVEMADRWLNLARLELTVFVDNEPAIRLYKKFGFVVEGTHARFGFRDGEYVDVYSMARLHPRAG